MIISFPFLRAKDLRMSLLIMITCSFLTLLYVGDIYDRLVYTRYKHIFRTIAVLMVFFAVNPEKWIWWKQYQNETATIKRRQSVTTRNEITRKMNTILLLPIYSARCQSAAASVVVSDTLDALYILRRCLCCYSCSLCAYLPLTTPPLWSYIPRVCSLTPAAYVVASNSSDASCIHHPLPKPLLLSLIPRARHTLPTPPLLYSIPWAC